MSSSQNSVAHRTDRGPFESAKLEPLLSRGVQLQILERPVNADDYDWYLVQAIGWPHRGWVRGRSRRRRLDRGWERRAAKPATFTAVEASLVLRSAAMRRSAAPTPRRPPKRALAGVECRVNGAVVTLVLVYQFGDARDAATTYLERLASSDGQGRHGRLPRRESGDAAWMAGDREGRDRYGPGLRRRHGAVGRRSDRLLSRRDGTANVRLTCGRPTSGSSAAMPISRTSIASRWRRGRPDEAGRRPGSAIGG